MDGRARKGQKGQAIVLFAVLLIGVLGAAGLLVDGGMAWANRRAAQSAADLAALAAARAVTDAGAGCNAAGQAVAQAAAAVVAGFNGFTTVTTEYPATTGSHTGCLYVRVSVSRSMSTTFSRVLGQTSWTPAASATSLMLKTQGAANANCTFCSLNTTNRNHTLLVDLGSTLVVDGEIYVNSSNGLTAGDPNSAIKLANWYVGGDGFDIFGTGGKIQATKITVVGGWETHDNGVATATQASCPAAQRPDPLAYATLHPPLTANVCIHQPVLADPLANFPSPNSGDYTTQATRQAKFTSSLTYTLQPGVYIGGISIGGSANVILSPGMYYMAGGGFIVTGSGSVTGNGVTIYSGGQTPTKPAADVDIETNGSVTLTPPTSGSFSGMTIFVARNSSSTVTLKPSNAAQCASVAASGQPQGCIGGIGGTIYAPAQDSLVDIKAAGTANLQVLSGKIVVTNGSTARFTFDSAGFASTSTTISLIE